MMKIDFHVHTHHSIDSLIVPDELARKSKSLGIIPAITDHNSVRAHNEMKSSGVPFIPGEEIFTDRGDLIGLFIEDEIKKGTQFEEALDRIHEQGGLSYLPHMFDISRKGGGDVPARYIRKIDLVEVFNARCLADSFNERAQDFSKKNHIPGLAGSDSHFLFEYGSTFNTISDFDLDDPKALMKSIESVDPALTMRKAPIYVRGTTRFVSLLKRISGRGKV